MSLIVGIPACSKKIDGMTQHATPARYGEALMGVAGALPVLLPPVGEAMLAILDRIDGLVLPGSPSNVEPHRYGVSGDLTPELHDPKRDDTTLPLARAAIARGMPVFAICRGIQELNVALGGTLHQKVQEVPGRLGSSVGRGGALAGLLVPHAAPDQGDGDARAHRRGPRDRGELAAPAGDRPRRARGWWWRRRRRTGRSRRCGWRRRRVGRSACSGIRNGIARRTRRARRCSAHSATPAAPMSEGKARALPSTRQRP